MSLRPAPSVPGRHRKDAARAALSLQEYRRDLDIKAAPFKREAELRFAAARKKLRDTLDLLPRGPPAATAADANEEGAAGIPATERFPPAETGRPRRSMQHVNYANMADDGDDASAAWFDDAADVAESDDELSSVVDSSADDSDDASAAADVAAPPAPEEMTRRIRDSANASLRYKQQQEHPPTGRVLSELKMKLENRVTRDLLIWSCNDNDARVNCKASQEELTTLQLIKLDIRMALRNETFVSRVAQKRKGGRLFKVDCYLERGANRNEVLVDIDEWMHNKNRYDPNDEADRKEYICDHLDEAAGKLFLCVNPMQSQSFKHYLHDEEVEQCKYVRELIGKLENKDMGERADGKGGRREIHFINYSVNNKHARKALEDKKSGRWDGVRFHQPVKRFLGRLINKKNSVRRHEPVE